MDVALYQSAQVLASYSQMGHTAAHAVVLLRLKYTAFKLTCPTAPLRRSLIAGNLNLATLVCRNELRTHERDSAIVTNESLLNSTKARTVARLANVSNL